VRVAEPWGSEDGSDQEALIRHATSDGALFHELPATYNVFPWRTNQSLPWCRSVHAVHKLSRLAKKGISKDCIDFLHEAHRRALARLRAQR